MFVLIYLAERRGIMNSVLFIKMDSLIKERRKLVNKLDRTSVFNVRKRNLLKEFISEIDKDIEILECDIENERQHLIRLGFNPDIPFESKSMEDLEKEYNLLMEIGTSMAVDLGAEGVQYVLEGNNELLSLALLDMLYMGSSDVLGRVDRTVRKYRI